MQRLCSDDADNIGIQFPKPKAPLAFSLSPYAGIFSPIQGKKKRMKIKHLFIAILPDNFYFCDRTFTHTVK